MSDVIISPNMSLGVPIVSQAPGPDWAQDYNSCLGVIDQHNHSAGSGVPITQAGISLSPASISKDSLGFNNSNAFGLRSVRFAPQGSALALATDLGCLYESGVDLFYNDGSGNQIRLTQGGSIVGTAGSITGLPSGTASAAYSAGTFIWQSATNTAANMDAGSYIFRNNTPSSNGVTLSPPASIPSNWQLFLPALPGATSFVTLDASGNLSGSIATLGALTTSNLSASAGILTSQLGTLGQQQSLGCGANATSSTTYVDVLNLTVTITTSGRPVFLTLMHDKSSGLVSSIEVSSSGGAGAQGTYAFLRNGSIIVESNLASFQPGTSAVDTQIPPSAFQHIDDVGAGTYTYKVQNKALSGTVIHVNHCVLLAYEI